MKTPSGSPPRPKHSPSRKGLKDFPDNPSHPLHQAPQMGFGTAIKVLHTMTILHQGWELDNEAWVAEMENGTKRILTTNHGVLVEWTKEDLAKKLEETLWSAKSIQTGMDHLPL